MLSRPLQPTPEQCQEIAPSDDPRALFVSLFLLHSDEYHAALSDSELSFPSACRESDRWKQGRQLVNNDIDGMVVVPKATKLSTNAMTCHDMTRTQSRAASEALFWTIIDGDLVGGKVPVEALHCTADCKTSSVLAISLSTVYSIHTSTKICPSIHTILTACSHLSYIHTRTSL